MSGRFPSALTTDPVEAAFNAILDTNFLEMCVFESLKTAQMSTSTEDVSSASLLLLLSLTALATFLYRAAQHTIRTPEDAAPAVLPSFSLPTTAVLSNCHPIAQPLTTPVLAFVVFLLNSSSTNLDVLFTFRAVSPTILPLFYALLVIQTSQ